MPGVVQRSFIADLGSQSGREVSLCGWVHRLRVLSRTTFLLLKDCSGVVQAVGHSAEIRMSHPKLDDVVRIQGRVREDARAPGGMEIELTEITVLNRSRRNLPFNSSSELKDVGMETRLAYRPLALRNEALGGVFRIQAAILEHFRAFLTANHFTEIVSSKIVESGTEGGTDLFSIAYFERSAYLAQSPQFYKEHGVAAFERVFETGHVYRAEPHATSRHLTEYYSLDLEMGFTASVDDIIDLEKELLTYIFEQLNLHESETLDRCGAAPLPSLRDAPVWDFKACIERLGRSDLEDDLDPAGERELCGMAREEVGVAAVFVVGFPLRKRPFYTHPRLEEPAGGGSESFDLLYEGLEITTGGQRLHKRSDLEAAMKGRGIDSSGFESHLAMFEMGMPPHGGLAIGLERLTARILGLRNVRDATLYPRDRYRVSP
jgi:nondiscriminating aspartyl-tRNA synthetase